MALTSGAKKFLVLAIIAALIGGGGYYFTKKKSMAKPVAVEQAVPAEKPAYFDPNMPAKKIEVAVPAVEEPKKAVVATVPKKKVAPKKSTVSHDKLEKELTSDQKALKEMAGDKL